MSNTRRSSRPPQKQATPLTTQVVVAVVVLLCIAAVVFISMRAGGEDEASAPTPADPESGQCAQPPAPPAQPKTYSEVPDPAEAGGATSTATIATTCGDIVVELDGEAAPQTVASFRFLSQDGYYDDSPCHRLTTANIFVLQCGDPTGTGSGGPGYSFGVENAPADGVYPPGTLAMARGQDPNTNGGQFFFVYDETSLPDPNGYTIFGTVTEGLDIVERIAQQGVEGGAGDGAPAQPISILDVSVEEQ
ncbi:MAG: peptidylprolyl isomerase [Actinomycetota bacterium]|nr:peptidylprolyl isomerase [Actinomycetota bacterium]